MSSVVKIKNKKILEEIQAKLTLKLGHKFSQQEILDKSLELLAENLDRFFNESFPFIEITPEYFKRIKESAVDIEYKRSGNDDMDIYQE